MSPRVIQAMLELSTEDRQQIVQLLVPMSIMENERSRSLFLVYAGLGKHVSQIDLSGNPQFAAIAIVDYLEEFGRDPTTAKEVLGIFLVTVRDVVGMEQQRTIDRLLANYRMMEAIGTTENSWDKLPKETIQEQKVLHRLSDRSQLILDGIRSTIGNYHLKRDRLVQQVIEQLESTQVVLVSGVAGSGKSGIAKDTIGKLAADRFTFASRAEEFAYPHLDTALEHSKISATAEKLSRVLAGQNRKILLVESVERLLERSIRDAFKDLLTLVAKDKNWGLLLTCRDYSADLICSGFLESKDTSYSVVQVPLLTARELKEIEVAHPTLSYPLSNSTLRQLLRNLYFLNAAQRIQWLGERELPQNEREFRKRCWREIVCASKEMSRQRGKTLVRVALQRARSLTPYVSCEEFDSQVVKDLREDSLIVSPSNNEDLIAPAHDVLEDWAILQWIEEKYATYAINEGSLREFAIEIGTHPAMRRIYRKWATELVEQNSEVADELFQSTAHDRELPAQFRDDTFISLLRSPLSVDFLERHGTELLANDKQLLRRAIHLLQVGCMTIPAEGKAARARTSSFDVPDGPAWACVLRLVQTHLQSFTPEDYSLLLDFIEDWARGVTWQNPYPAGYKSVAAIAHWLLPNFDDDLVTDHRMRTLRVIAKIPNGDRDRFAALLQEDDFREIIFEEVEGIHAARDVPALIVSTAKDYLLYSEEDFPSAEISSMMPIVEPQFGIKGHMHFDSVSGSADCGPFLILLHYHPRKGLDFIIEVCNYGANWYARLGEQLKFIEPPFEITLTFADRKSQTQWCNASGGDKEARQ